MATMQLRPARNSGAPAAGSRLIRNGTRCVIFTQLPVAFWAGSNENSEPVAGLRLSTVAFHSTPG